jgi:hypothetical protein
MRVYTKPQGQQPDFSVPVVLSTVCSLPLYAFSPQDLMQRALINYLAMASDLGQDLHQVLLRFVAARSTCPCMPCCSLCCAGPRHIRRVVLLHPVPELVLSHLIL